MLVSKIYPSGLIFGGPIYHGSYIRDVNWISYLGGIISGGRINRILQYLEN